MIIYGSRGTNKVLGQISFVCPQCQRQSIHAVVRRKRWFTLFFIPIFPFYITSNTHCGLCGYQQKIPNKQANAMLAGQPGIPQVPQPNVYGAPQPGAYGAPQPGVQPVPPYPSGPYGAPQQGMPGQPPNWQQPGYMPPQQPPRA